MKPRGEIARFPRTDSFFHSDIGQRRGGFWSFNSDEGESERRKFYNFTRGFLIESARERMKEMIVFALVVFASAWPVGYMIISVVKLLLRGQPLDHQ